jgi:2-C-methyl-D-erythritol 2,4-cyclodiphosphate synthase
MNKVGIGQDSHKFLKEKGTKDLILGGLKINYDFGLDGNSDADVIIHSLCNALSSAIGGESLSTWADKMCQEGIKDSVKYLEVILEKIKENNYSVGNISIAIEAKEPKLQTEIERMKNKLAEVLDINVNQIGITATSGESLTAFGRGEGIQAFSIVNLFSNEN